MSSQVILENNIDIPSTSYPPSRAPSLRNLVSAEGFKHEIKVAALPEQDKGYAWIYLIAAFSIEAIAFSFTYSIGVFRQVWVITLFPNDEGLVTLAASLQSGLIYAAAMIMGPILTRYPEWRSVMQYAGIALSAAGILLSAFATKAWQLIPSAGIMQPVGSAMMYVPLTALLFQWFSVKRGLATGILYAGTGVGGAVLPPVMRVLLSRFGYRASVISLAIAYGVLASIASYFIRERIPVARATSLADRPRRRRIPLDFLRRSPFWAFAATVSATSLGVFLPGIYLPTYGTDIGLSQSTGTLLLVVMNIASIGGQLALGFASDRYPIKVVLPAACMGAAISAFLIFGFATNFAVLCVFCVAWGFFGQSATALWSRLITVASRDDPIAPPTIFGLFALLRGICSVVAGPISTLLLDRGAMPGASFGYGIKNYGGMLLFIGGVNALGCLASLCYRD